MIEKLFAGGVTSLVRTLRIKWEGGPLPERAVIAFWHSKMLAGWWVSRAHATAMVSKSKDGEYLSAILSGWGYSVIRGSSGKGGMEALEEAIAKIENSESDRLVITPDGPRGPAEVFKRGAFIAARKLELPLVFLDIKYHSPLVLSSSWDHFEVPYPFTRVDIRPYVVDTTMFPDDREAQEQFLLQKSKSYQSVGPIKQLEPALGG